MPHRLAGARPPDHDQRRAAELRLGDRADPVGHAGPGGEHGEPGSAGQLAHRLGGEGGGLLVAYVEDPHRRVGGHRAVVHREDVGAGEGEHHLDAVGAGHGDGVLAGVGLDGRAGIAGPLGGCSVPGSWRRLSAAGSCSGACVMTRG